MRDLPDDDQWLPERLRAIGARFREERLRQNATQDQVWMAARVTRWTYQRVESGQDCNLSTLLRIAWVLDVSLEELDE
ncbi:helix-turn-helix transcriptional regulator [Streptomyces olindensis]|uniref:helix-turn-helix transcriptional regulator n=1 Tax=Streptomyces olindensis TaxID=358823 RepID=UPI0036A4FF74